MENDFSASTGPLIAQLAEQRTVVGFCCYPRVAGSIPAQRSSYLNDLYMIQIRIQSHPVPADTVKLMQPLSMISYKIVRYYRMWK